MPINESEIETLVRIRLFEALSQAESRYKTLVERLRDIVFQYDSEWNIVFLNQAWQETLGFSMESSLNSNFLDFIDPDDKDLITEIIKSDSATKENGYTEVRLCHQDGYPIWFQLSIKPDAEGGVGLLHNIDHHKSLKKHLENEVAKRTNELVQANNTKDQFFAIIGHDLRGPVGSLAKLLDHKAKKNQSLDENIVRALSLSTNHIYQLLDNLLTWARAQKGQLEITKKNFALDQITQETLDVLKSSAENKGVELFFQSVSEPVTYADPAMISTVIRNLVNNAIKFTNKGENVRVNIQKDHNYYLISITDTGVGMSAEQLANLFVPGTNHGTSLGTSGEKGTGLGLLLCKEFIDANDGIIGVDSKQGEGSHFWFKVPVGKTASNDTSLNSDNIEDALQGLHVLLAEDDPLQLDTNATLLNELGMDVEVAEDGKEALFYYFARQPKLVLLDIDMPYLNGVEVKKRMTEVNGEQPLILAVTSYSQSELEDIYKDLSFDGYLTKPLDKDALLTLLQKNINRLLPTTKVV